MDSRDQLIDKLSALSDADRRAVADAADERAGCNLARRVLDHGYIELIEPWGSDERIIEAARMSTAKGFLGWGPTCAECGWAGEDHEVGCSRPDKLKPGDEKLLRFLWENKHATPFEMAGATFEVQAPIFVFREWHRHRVPFGYNELSARYTPMPDVNYVPTLERLLARGDGRNRQAGTVAGVEALTEENAARWLKELRHAYEVAEVVYQFGLKLGVPKELARLPVPVGRYSRMRATGNLRGWLGFLALRMAPNAQWEIRQFATAAHDMLAHYFPRTLALFDEGRS